MRRSHVASVLVALALGGCSGSASAVQTKIPHPDRAGTAIEYFAAHPAGRGPWPTVLFLHGHQAALARTGGRAFADWGVLDRFARRGYLAIAVSLPGYGGSSGPEDFAGPFTQHAVRAVIARLKADRLARRDRILIEGVSLGAVTGALVAANDPQIAGLVLISGLYDLPAYLTKPKSLAATEIRAVVTAQTDGSIGALQARSALPLAPHIRAATLILSGARDDRTDPEQARRMAEEINAHGGRATVHIYPSFGHQIPVKARDAEIDAFIDATLLK